MTTSSRPNHRQRITAIGVAFALSLAAAPCMHAQQSCLTTRGLVMTPNIGPVGVSGHFATVGQHGNWDTRPTIRFAKVNQESVAETGIWKAVWSIDDVELRASTAFVAADDQLIALDLRDPAEPNELSHVDLVNAERLAIAGSRAHVLSTTMDGSTLLDVIDISNPSAMERRGSVRWDPDEPKPHSLAADRGFVAVADLEGVFVIDARDLWNPVRGGRWFGETTIDIALVDGLAVVAHAADGNPSRFGIRLIDVSNPGHPQERGFWEAPSEVVAVTSFGRDVAAATSSHGIFVISLNDPDRPAAIDHWDGFGLGAVGLSAAWPNLVIANSRIGLIVLGLKPECLPPRQPSGRVRQ